MRKLTFSLLLGAATLAVLGFGSVRCASVPIQQAEAEQVADMGTVQGDIQGSNLSPATKKKDVAIIDSGKKMIVTQGQTITKKDAEIKNLEWYKRFFWHEVAALGCIVAGAGVFLFLKLRPKVSVG